MKPILDFLKKLKNNNTKDWFETNKEEYLQAKLYFETKVDDLIQKLQLFDKELGKDLTSKNCTFRIYKDVRFSKDKKPYKTNFGASINPGGKKSPVPGYYLHIEPGNCFFAGGSYMPMPDALSAIRQEIDYNGKELEKILSKKDFIKTFKGIEEIELLKTTPKGYEKEHAYLHLLKHKHFIASCELSEKMLLNEKAMAEVANYGKTLYPFLQYLRKAIS